MAGKMNLTEMNTRHEELNRKLEEKADKVRSEMGFPTSMGTKPAKAKERITDKLMNEVIIYGGLPVRRKDVYRDALRRTGSTKAADMFAFGQQTKPAPEGWEPLSYDELQKIDAGESMKISKTVKAEKFRMPKSPKPKSRPSKQKRHGPYFKKGGRLSRHPIRG